MSSVNLISDRENEIIKFGCPVCGAMYDIHVSNVEDTKFQCHNPDCPSGLPLIPFKEADAACPKGNRRGAIGVVCRRRDVFARYLEASEALAAAREDFEDARRKSAEHGKQTRKCKDAYYRFRRFRLFDEKGHRLYTKTSPFVLMHPLTGYAMYVWNIRSKRAVFAELAGLWQHAKKKFNRDLKNIRKAREAIKEQKPNVVGLKIEVDALDKSLRKYPKLGLEYIPKEIPKKGKAK